MFLAGAIMSHYTVILEEEADGGYVATVPALPGCVSQGDTREEALRNMQEAAELYIEDCREVNMQPVILGGGFCAGRVGQYASERCAEWQAEA
jgi:predicted RNase H-like HicB family nuclease